MVNPKANSEVLNIVSGNHMKVKDVFYQIRKLIGINGIGFDDMPYLASVKMSLYADTNKEKKILSWMLSLSSCEGTLKSIISSKSKWTE